MLDCNKSGEPRKCRGSDENLEVISVQQAKSIKKIVRHTSRRYGKSVLGTCVNSTEIYNEVADFIHLINYHKTKMYSALFRNNHV